MSTIVGKHYGATRMIFQQLLINLTTKPPTVFSLMEISPLNVEIKMGNSCGVLSKTQKNGTKAGL